MKNKKIITIGIMLMLTVTAGLVVASAEEKIDEGTLPPLPNPFMITELKEGWNIIGYPNQGTISKYDISIIYNNETYNWTKAVNDWIIINFIYDWDQEHQWYVFVDNIEGGYGYWMFSYFNCELWSLY